MTATEDSRHQDGGPLAAADGLTMLGQLPAFNWNDMRASGDQAARVLDRLAAEPALLRDLLERTARDERLLSMCERHSPFDKLVVYDAPERQFRIRMHIWRNTEFERAHQHRFSFTSRMLQGSYRHVLYNCQLPLSASADTEHARRHMDPDHPDMASGIDVNRLLPALEYDMGAGEGYTLHHDAVHATMVAAETVSLILRGPAEKEHAFVANVSDGRVYWRFGRGDETEERIHSKQLGPAGVAALLPRLADLGVIA